MAGPWGGVAQTQGKKVTPPDREDQGLVLVSISDRLLV
jgi:hypothetical protein